MEGVTQRAIKDHVMCSLALALMDTLLSGQLLPPLFPPVPKTSCAWRAAAPAAGCAPDSYAAGTLMLPASMAPLLAPNN